MRALVVYESTFGNTSEVAAAVGRGLATGFEVEVTEVGDAPASTDAFDLIVVGAPTHAWGMSNAMTREGARKQAREEGIEPISRGIGVREWLRGLGPSAGAIATFDTAMRAPGPFPHGSAARKVAWRLERRGFAMVTAPIQFYVQDVGGPLEEGEADRARAWGEGLAAAYVAAAEAS